MVNDISNAVLLIEIEDFAQNEMKEVGLGIDKSRGNWNANSYHLNILQEVKLNNP